MRNLLSEDRFFNTATGAYTIMLVVIILTSALFYYNWFNSNNERNQELQQVVFKSKAIITEVENLQELSMHYDGNSILEVGREFKYKFSSDSLKVIKTERIVKTQIDVRFWDALYKIEVSDTVNVGVLRNGKSLILFE